MNTWLHIIGGGLSGLSLGEALASYPTLPGPVVISEPNPGQLCNKTFSYWFNPEERTLLNPNFIAHRWRLSTSTQSVVHQGQRMRYGTTTGLSAFSRALAAIEAHPQIQLREEQLAQPPSATHVIDTRPQPESAFKLVQSFSGLEIETQAPHRFAEVGLMESMEATASGIRFCYRLPLGPNRVLIEHTEFSTAPAAFSALDEANRAVIDSTWGTEHQIIRQEQAHIPMGLKPCQNHWGLPFGSRAGMARDATGYGYKTIRKESVRTAFALITTGKLSAYKPSPWMRWTDQVFLNLLAQRPDVMPDSLLHIAHNMSGDAFGQFMMGQSPWAVARVIGSAPVKPFACALIGRYQWI